MAKNKMPGPEPSDITGAEVNRLLRKLPGADVDGVEVISDGQGGSGSAGRAGKGKRKSIVGVGSETSSEHRTTTEERAVLWGLLVLCIVFAVLLQRWPYEHECGMGLYGFLGALTIFIVATGWAVMAAFKQRGPYSHTIALVLVFFGIVLAAEQILPRIGYAKDVASWQCNE